MEITIVRVIILELYVFELKNAYKEKKKKLRRNSARQSLTGNSSTIVITNCRTIKK